MSRAVRRMAGVALALVLTLFLTLVGVRAVYAEEGEGVESAEPVVEVLETQEEEPIVEVLETTDEEATAEVELSDEEPSVDDVEEDAIVPMADTCGTCDWNLDTTGALYLYGGTLEDWGDESPWMGNKYITSVVCFDVVHAPTCKNLFKGCINIEFMNLDEFDNASSKSCEGMFEECYSLRTIMTGTMYDYAKPGAMPVNPMGGVNRWGLLEIDEHDVFAWMGWLSESEVIETRSKKATTLTANAYIGSPDAVTIDPIPDQAYTGKPITPALTITSGSLVLGESLDYDVTYKDNVDVGTATVTVTGKYYFYGSVDVTFNIVDKVDLSSATLSGLVDTMYTGEEIKQKPTVKLGSKTLKEGTDYTLAYGDNKRPGIATVFVNGKGSYMGQVQGTHRITFTDVQKSGSGPWYYSVVHEAAALGLISGYSGSKDGQFGPNDNVTRGQAATILWNMTGKPTAGLGAKDFPDVKSGAFYYEAVRWCSSQGVVNGYNDGTFGPEELVTREQLAVMLRNYASKAGGKETPGSASDYATMTDAASVSGYAKSAVGWCFKQGIMTGTSDKRINPQGTATRAETAKMMVMLRQFMTS